MEKDKTKNINTIAIIVSIFSGLMILANLMGLLTWSFLFNLIGENNPEFLDSPNLPFVFQYYTEGCLLMISLGTLALISGINMRKHKMWANQLLSIISVVIVLIFLAIPFATFSFIPADDFAYLLIAISVLNSLFWSTPLVMLIVFLKKNKGYFK